MVMDYDGSLVIYSHMVWDPLSHNATAPLIHAALHYSLSRASTLRAFFLLPRNTRFHPVHF
jgi:hypothetical protein